MILSNRNAITCNVCSSKLRVKNKDVNLKIGGWGGGAGGLLIVFLINYCGWTKNWAYLALLVPLISAELLIAFLLVKKYIVLQAEEPKTSSET
jgi:hypothetical protein